MTGRDEVPAAPSVRPRQVRSQPTVAAVAVLHLRVLAVHVVDPVLEVPEEADRVEVLPHHVARVPVEAERLAVPDRLEGAHGRPVVVRDLARVHLVGEPHADLVEHVEDRVPAVGEVLVAGVDHLLRRRREHRDVLPDRRAGEADDGLHAELRGEARGVLHLLGGALTHALRVAVAPHLVGEDAAVALVDRVVADGLALEVVRDRPDLEVVLLEQGELALDVAGLVPAPRVEVVAPAGELEAVVAPPGGELRDLLERQVGPLAGEQGDGASHGSLLVELFRRYDGQGIGVQALPLPELCSTAPSTRCTCRPSANDGRGLPPGGDVLDEVLRLVREAVLVAEHVAGRPPGRDVRMLRLGHEDLREALERVGGAVRS